MKLNKRIFSIIISLILVWILILWQFGEEQRFADQISNKCQQQVNIEKCIGGQLVKLEDKLSFGQMASLIKKLINTQNGPFECHELAHQIAGDYARKSSRSELLDDSIDPYICGGGFLHGVMESSLSKIRLSESLDPNEICQKYSSDFSKSNCAHMLGHVYLFMIDDVKMSVSFCQSFPDKNLGDYCLAGLFMEHTLGTVSRSHDSKYPPLVVDEIYLKKYENLCDSLDGLPKSICFKEAARLYLSIEHQDIGQVLKRCQKIADETSVSECQKYAVFLYANNNLSNQGFEVCENSYLTINRERCREDIGVGIVINSFKNINFVDQICKNDPVTASVCWKNIRRRIIDTFGASRSFSECLSLENNQKISCLKRLLV